MDWYSRYVLSWKLNNTLDTSYCVEALEEALMCYGVPEIFNSDQDTQYTSEAFVEVLARMVFKLVCMLRVERLTIFLLNSYGV